MQFDFNELGFAAFATSLAGISVFWIVVFWVVTAIIHITFAVAVYRDAKSMATPIFVGSVIWMLATLIGGVFVAAIYWAMHHSSLNSSIQTRQTETDKETIL